MKGSIIDIYDDSSLVIYNKIQDEYNLPFVKKASIFGDLGRKEKKAFALPNEKKFPMDIPDDILMSYLYLEKTAVNLPKDLADKAKSNLLKAASLMGVCIPDKVVKKTASKANAINPEDFAVSIPLSDCSTELLQKRASFIYGDDLCLYPLNSKENIELCNRNFPRGLDDEFESLRPLVATKIASLTSNPSEKVKAYSTKIPLSQVENTIYKKASLYPFYKNDYLKALNELKEDDNFVKFASILNEIDLNSGAYKSYSEENLASYRYLQGIKDDTNYNERNVKLKTASIKFKDFKNNKEKFASVLDRDSAGKLLGVETPKQLNQIVDNLSEVDKDNIERLL